MRITIIAAAAAIAFVAAPAPAQTAKELCSKIGTLSNGIMVARQNGVLMSVMIESLHGDNEQVNDTILALILDAYRVSRFGTAEFKSRAAADFQNSKELACYSAFGDRS